MGSYNDIAKSVVVRIKNDPHVVVFFQPVKPGKGVAFVRTRLKNLVSGSVIEQTFKANDPVDIVSVERQTLQYLYTTDTEFVFMRTDTYEQVSLARDTAAESMQWIKEGQEVIGVFFEERLITIDVPKKVVLTVTDTEMAVRGDTSGAPMKDAALENGTHINVPLFVEQGDKIAINTETGAYSERANE
ncbi:MAG: elongation factor P [Patescibacteria group bacterium]